MESKKEVMHTPEPWLIDGYGNIVCDDGDQLPFGGVAIPMACGPRMDRAKSNVRRVVACVNACKGIGTETLERYHEDHKPDNGFGLHREADLIAQRDDLLDQLKQAMLWVESEAQLSVIRHVVARCEDKS